MSKLESIVNECLLSLKLRLNERINRMHPANLQYIMAYDYVIRYEEHGITIGGYNLMTKAEVDQFIKDMYLKIREVS